VVVALAIAKHPKFRPRLCNAKTDHCKYIPLAIYDLFPCHRQGGVPAEFSISTNLVEIVVWLRFLRMLGGLFFGVN
jgi:hypothetical protein